MAGYEVKITCSGKEDIVLTTIGTGNSNVKTIEFVKGTSPNANNRANSMYCEFKITGVLDEKTKDDLKLVADWALDVDKSTLYRTAQIKVRSDDTDSDNIEKILRNYEFSNMYVIEYKELFDKNEEDGENYFLHMGQKAEKSTQNINTH